MRMPQEKCEAKVLLEQMYMKAKYPWCSYVCLTGNLLQMGGIGRREEEGEEYEANSKA